MTNEEMQKFELMKRRIEQLQRENKILKERLRYKTAADVQYSKDDAEVFMIVKMRNCR